MFICRSLCGNYLLYIREQRIWLFFRKWRIQTLWLVQNWNLRHIYKIRFLIFWAVFCALAFKVWKKYKYDLKKFFCEKITKGVTLISNPLKKLLKNAPKKVMSKQVWRTKVKVQKVHISFLLITFFGAFFKTFSTESKSAWNSAFFDTFLDFSKKNFLGHISTFFKLGLQMRRKRLKKRKIFFYECVLEFNYATIKGFA